MLGTLGLRVLDTLLFLPTALVEEALLIAHQIETSSLAGRLFHDQTHGNQQVSYLRPAEAKRLTHGHTAKKCHSQREVRF